MLFSCEIYKLIRKRIFFQNIGQNIRELFSPVQKPLNVLFALLLCEAMQFFGKLIPMKQQQQNVSSDISLHTIYHHLWHQLNVCSFTLRFDNNILYYNILYIILYILY